MRLTKGFVFDEGEDGNVPDGSPEEVDQTVQDPALVLLITHGSLKTLKFIYISFPSHGSSVTLASPLRNDGGLIPASVCAALAWQVGVGGRV